MAVDAGVRRLHFGVFVPAGGGDRQRSARVEPCLGYLMEHPAGLLLADSGMGSHPEVEAQYRPRRWGLSATLADAGARVEDVRLVVNCHLHFDHCGGDPQLAGPARPQTVPVDVRLLGCVPAGQRDHAAVGGAVGFEVCRCARWRRS